MKEPPEFDGHYARKQFDKRNSLISWSHRSRFRTALELARRYRGGRMLDYGCGDGTFFQLLEADGWFDNGAEAVGAELDDAVLASCRERLGDRGEASFVRIDDLNQKQFADSFDIVFCMEVLEHVVALDAVISALGRVLKPGGELVVSVPVEIGPALWIKQGFRRLARLRGMKDYPGVEPYQVSELFGGLVAGSKQHINRPKQQWRDGLESYSHKGFNYLALQSRLEKDFRLCERFGTPLKGLPVRMNSQVWWVFRLEDRGS